jgi:hypothetical protein
MLRLYLLSTFCFLFVGTTAGASERVELIVDAELPMAATSALTDLTDALRKKKVVVIRNKVASDACGQRTGTTCKACEDWILSASSDVIVD